MTDVVFVNIASGGQEFPEVSPTQIAAQISCTEIYHSRPQEPVPWGCGSEPALGWEKHRTPCLVLVLVPVVAHSARCA